MKQLLKIWLLAILPLFTQAQELKITLPDTLAGKEWVKNLVKQELKKLGVVTQSPCPEGPKITKIFDVTPTGLQVQFHGKNVFGIDFKVTNSARQTVSQGAIKPTGNTLTIPYTKQDPGSFTLVLSGNNCIGTDSEPFTISGATGVVVDPPVIVVPPTDIPDGQAKVIEQVVPYPGYMKLQRVRVKGGWLYSDLRTRAETGLAPGFYIFYEINGKRIVVDQLKDYFVSENVRVVGIVKSSFKDGISEWWKTSPAHGGSDSNQGYFEPGHTYAARASDIIVKDNTLFPAGYDPYNNQRVQWPSLVANTTAKESFIYAMPKGETPVDVMIAKGVNRFSGGTLYDLGEPKTGQMLAAGYGYNEVPTSPVVFGWTDKLGYDDWIGPQGRATEDIIRSGVIVKRKGETIDNWPSIWNRRYLSTPDGAREPMTWEEGAQAGRNFSTQYTLNVLETEEQSHAISPHWPFAKAFSEEWNSGLAKHWEGSGKTIFTSWNYFRDMGVNNGWGSAQDRKDVFRKDLSAWPENPMLPGRNLEKFTAYCIPMYFSFTDAGFDIAYELALQYYVQKKTGKYAIVFPAATLENNPNGIVEWRLEQGKYYHKDKLPQDPSILITAGALSRIFCKALVPWGFPSYSSKPFRLYDYYLNQGWQQKGLWVPAGNGETQTADTGISPIVSKVQGTTASLGTTDNLAFGKDLAEKTFGLTDGGVDEWLRYRKDGGAWVEPVNSWADDAINARENKATLVFSRRLNGVISVLVCDPGATDCGDHQIEYQINGKTYSTEIAGITPFMVNLPYPQ